MLCAIWHHLHNLKYVKYILRGVLLLAKLLVTFSNFLKVTVLHGRFSGILNCTFDTQSHKALHIMNKDRVLIYHTSLAQTRKSK